MVEQQIQLANVQATNSFNGKKLLSRAIDFWYLYILSLTICISFAWFKVHYATPMYKVFAQVLVQDDKNSSSQALNSNGLDYSSLFSGKTNMANEIAIMQTTDLCKRVVDNLKLYTGYYHKGSVRSVELYKGSPFTVAYHPDNDTIAPLSLELKFPSVNSNEFIIVSGGHQFKWHFNDTLHYNKATFYFKNNGGGFDIKASYLFVIQNPDAVASSIAGNLNSDLLSLKSTIINLVYNTNLPEKGIDVLRGIAQAYINRNLEQKNLSSDSTIQFINSRLVIIGSDLGNIETTIQRFKQKNKIANLEGQAQQLVTNKSAYDLKGNDLDVQLQVIQTMLAYVENDQNNRRPVPALLNSDATFGGLISNYNTEQLQRDKLLLSLKEDNPIVANADLQIAGLRGDIIRSLKSQQRALTISKQELEAQNNLINGQIYNVPAQQRQFLDYSREQDVKQALYLFLLQRREEIAIAKASNASNASLISSPKASYTPYEPVSSTAMTISILIGLILPTAFITLKFLLNNKVTSREDVVNATPANILSEIGHNTEQGLLNIKDKGRSIIAEQFRIFRTNMDFALANKKSPVIMITSCVSGEGKSFIAANLGFIYAISGKKVLLVELDLRRPKLSKMLGISNEAGFSNYIISNQPASDYIQTVQGYSSLDVLPSGPVPPNPAELLLSDKTNTLINDLKKQYDYIIIDTAPIGAVTDAQIAGRFADVSLYIIRQNYSIKNSIEVVNDMVLNSKLSNLYIVLNDVSEGASYKYGYGYRYSYGYGYGYADRIDKKKWWQLKRK